MCSMLDMVMQAGGHPGQNPANFDQQQLATALAVLVMIIWQSIDQPRI